MQTETRELFSEVEGLVAAGRLNEAEMALTEIAQLARAEGDAAIEGMALGDLASVQAEMGDARAAWLNWQAAAGVLEGLAGSEWELVRTVYWPMARHANSQGNAQAAAHSCERAAALLRSLAVNSEDYSIHLANLLAEVASWKAEAGDNEGAERGVRNAVTVLETALNTVPAASSRLRDELGAMLERHAEVLHNMGDTPAAAGQLRQARDVYEGLGCAEGVVASLVSLARALWNSGNLEESRQLARDAASQAEDAIDARPAVRGAAFETQARFLLAEGKLDEADTYFQLAEILYRRQAEESDPDEWIVPLQMVVAQRATLLIQLKDVRGAAAAVEELVEFWQPYLEQEPARRLAAYLMPAQRLMQLYQTLGENEKAESLKARMRDLQAAV